MANLTDLTSDVLNSEEPQRTNNGLFYVVGLPTFTLGSISISSGAASSTMIAAIEQFPLPKRSLGVLELSHLNEKRKYLGRPVFDPMSVIFKDLIVSNNVSVLLDGWFKQGYNPTDGKVHLKSNYAKNGYVTMYAPDGTLERQLNVYGLMITNFDPGDIDHTGEDYTRITVEFNYDKSEYSATPGTPPGAWPSYP